MPPRMKAPKPFQPIILLEGARTPVDTIAEKMVWAMHREVIETMQTERSAQQEIGLSEIGLPCMKCLARKLSMLYVVNDPSWKAQIGTFGHAGLEEHLRYRYTSFLPDGLPAAGGTKYLWEVDPNAILHLEEDVALPLGDGTFIPGHCDLFIEGVDYGIVWDHKILGARSLTEKAKHIGPQYDTQLDGYGLGWELKGKHVTHVALGALPRDGHVNEAVFVLRPYNRQRVVDRLALIADLKAAAGIAGWEAVIQAQPTDSACWDCGRFEAAEEQDFFAAFRK